MFYASSEQAQKVMVRLRNSVPRKLSVKVLRTIVLSMYGFETWMDYRKASKFQHSLFDEMVDEEERCARRERQIKVLMEYKFDEALAERIIRNVQPTAQKCRKKQMYGCHAMPKEMRAYAAL